MGGRSRGAGGAIGGAGGQTGGMRGVYFCRGAEEGNGGGKEADEERRVRKLRVFRNCTRCAAKFSASFSATHCSYCENFVALMRVMAAQDWSIKLTRLITSP